MASKKKVEKVAKVLKEYKKGELHSGSKKGPVVTSKKQAVAIAMSEAGMSKKKSEIKNKMRQYIYIWACVSSAGQV